MKRMPLHALNNLFCLIFSSHVVPPSLCQKHILLLPLIHYTYILHISPHGGLVYQALKMLFAMQSVSNKKKNIVFILSTACQGIPINKL